MVKCKATMNDGRAMVVLGLSDGNVAHLKNGEPIYFDAAALRISEPLGSIVVFYGKDDGELARTVRTMIGPQTEVITVPKGDGRRQ